MTNQLISNLTAMTLEHIARVEEFLLMDEESLTWKATPETWNVLECIEHLRLYSEFYIPEIRKRIQHASPSGGNRPFKSGLLGGYFARMMKPGQKKTSTFRAMNPNGRDLSKKVLEDFLEQENQMLELLRQASHIDLTRTKASISIASWMKLRLGDVLQVVIYHNARHILQAQNSLKASPYSQSA